MRTCGTVRAGVYFFPPPGFQYQKPQGNKREYLMMLPAHPGTDLIISQSGLALGSLKAVFNAMAALTTRANSSSDVSFGALDK
jgi:hypothetical protein